MNVLVPEVPLKSPHYTQTHMCVHDHAHAHTYTLTHTSRSKLAGGSSRYLQPGPNSYKRAQLPFSGVTEDCSIRVIIKNFQFLLIRALCAENIKPYVT